MKLKDRPRVEPLYNQDNPRIELLYNQDNIIIPCEKGQNTAIQRVLDSIGKIDPNKEYTIEIKVVRQRRSLDANAYYFKLVRELEKVFSKEDKSITTTEIHNELLAQLGIPWLDKDGQRHWILQKDNDWWRKQKETHFCPTDKTEDRNGIPYRWFYLLLPSHLMDTKEMSRLIDLVVTEAKQQGIETLTPNELERMKATWGK